MHDSLPDTLAIPTALVLGEVFKPSRLRLIQGDPLILEKRMWDLLHWQLDFRIICFLALCDNDPRVVPSKLSKVDANTIYIAKTKSPLLCVYGQAKAAGTLPEQGNYLSF